MGLSEQMQTDNIYYSLPDVFLTSAAPSINLIPQLVKAEPGFTNALDLPVGYRTK